MSRRFTIFHTGLLTSALLLPGFAAMADTLPAPDPPAGAVPYTAPLPAQPAQPDPPSPVAAGLALLLPTAAGGYLAAALLRARRNACPPCPSCGSKRGAVVGPVGQYHLCCRCHDCGHLWEKDAAVMSRSVTASRPPGGLH